MLFLPNSSVLAVSMTTWYRRRILVTAGSMASTWWWSVIKYVKIPQIMAWLSVPTLTTRLQFAALLVHIDTLNTCLHRHTHTHTHTQKTPLTSCSGSVMSSEIHNKLQTNYTKHVARKNLIYCTRPQNVQQAEWIPILVRYKLML